MYSVQNYIILSRIRLRIMMLMMMRTKENKNKIKIDLINQNKQNKKNAFFVSKL